MRTLLAACCAAGLAGVAGAGAAATDPGRIVFASNRAFYLAHPQLVLLTPGGRTRRILLTAPRGTLLEAAAWSPDAARIALRVGAGVDVVSTEGRVLRRFRGRPAADPAWSPDGRLLALTTDVGLSRLVQVFRLVDGRRVLRVAVGPSDIGNLWGGVSWSPDGSRLAVGTVDPKAKVAQGTLGIVSVATGRRSRLFRPPVGSYVFEPKWSPDGRTIAFTRVDQLNDRCGEQEMGEDVDVMTVDVSTRRAHGFARCGWHAVWSPDGRRLAAVFNRTLRVIDRRSGLARGVGRGDAVSWAADSRRLVLADRGAVYAVDLASGRRAAVAAEAPERELRSGPVVSPNGKSIAIVDIASADQATSDLYTAASDGTHVRRIVVDGIEPRWSPDRSRVVFVRSEQVLVADADGTHERVVRPGFSASWSPDGQRLAVWAKDGIHVVELASGADALVVPGATHPVWSADGSKLTWSRDDAIWTSAPDGSEVAQVVPAPQPVAGTCATVGAFWPAWSPDGSKLAYTKVTADCLQSAGIFYEIHVMNADGRNDRLLTKGAFPGNDYDPTNSPRDPVGASRPVWSPDGSRILYIDTSRYRGQLKLIGASGGRPELVARGPGSVVAVDWR
jgi:Tol biopolymer transport system component